MKPTRCFQDVKVGEDLPPLDVATTAALVVGGALASRDFTPEERVIYAELLSR